MKYTIAFLLFLLWAIHDPKEPQTLNWTAEHCAASRCYP